MSECEEPHPSISSERDGVEAKARGDTDTGFPMKHHPECSWALESSLEVCILLRRLHDLDRIGVAAWFEEARGQVVRARDTVLSSGFADFDRLWPVAVE